MGRSTGVDGSVPVIVGRLAFRRNELMRELLGNLTGREIWVERNICGGGECTVEYGSLRRNDMRERVCVCRLYKCAARW